jgi:hypothetical protein
MIRATDLATAAAWTRPIGSTAPGDGVDAHQGLHAAEDPGSAVAIGGDVSPAARGLSAEQHARRVLSFLQDHAA